jgi:hypothetical protein
MIAEVFKKANRFFVIVSLELLEEVKNAVHTCIYT